MKNYHAKGILNPCMNTTPHYLHIVQHFTTSSRQWGQLPNGRMSNDKAVLYTASSRCRVSASKSKAQLNFVIFKYFVFRETKVNGMSTDVIAGTKQNKGIIMKIKGE